MGAETIKIWQAQVVPSEGLKPAASADPTSAAGTLLRADELGVWVQCGVGVLKLTQLQRAGGKRLAVADFMRGFPLQAGQVLGSGSGGTVA
jgi:methionyl-tRNA formyltransferase